MNGAYPLGNKNRYATASIVKPEDRKNSDCERIILKF